MPCHEGTYWSLANPAWPPLPGNFHSFPVWAMAGGNSYLLNDLDFDYNAEIQSVAAHSGMRMMSFSGAPGFDDTDTNGVGTNTYEYGFAARLYTTNDLWLEITGKTNITTTNGTAFLVIHPPWNVTNTVYDLFDTTNLATLHDWNWVLRCAPGQTNLTVTNLASAQDFFILGLTNDADGDGMSDAFENLASGTDPANGDQNINGIPDGWEWHYFGNLNQTSNTDYDNDGTNILAEYSGAIAP